MEAEAAEISDGSKRPPFIFRQNALRRILHHEQVMPSCNIHDLVHLTAHSGVMNRNDPTGFLRDGVLDQLFIHVHGIRTDIHEHGHGPAQHEGVRSGYEGEGGHNHFVPRPDAAQKRGQLRSMGAGSGHQAFRRSGALLEPPAGLFGKFPIPADFLVFHRLPEVFVLLSGKGRNVEPDFLMSCKR